MRLPNRALLATMAVLFCCRYADATETVIIDVKMSCAEAPEGKTARCHASYKRSENEISQSELVRLSKELKATHGILRYHLTSWGNSSDRVFLAAMEKAMNEAWRTGATHIGFTGIVRYDEKSGTTKFERVPDRSTKY